MKSPSSQGFPALLWALPAAVAVNIFLLVLIEMLLAGTHTPVPPAPIPQPVNFIRLPSPPEKIEPEPLVKPQEIVPVQSEPTPQRSPPRQRKPESQPGKKAPPEIRSVKPRRESKPSSQATKKGGAGTQSPASGKVPMPRIDIPAGGQGVGFPEFSGSDSRITAPPKQWDPAIEPPGGAGDDGMDGEGDFVARNLVVVKRVLPEYPSRAQRRGIEGWVLIELVVTRTGSVWDAKVVDANPKEIFDEAALKAIRQWRFKPRYVEGRAVQTRARQKMTFRLAPR